MQQVKEEGEDEVSAQSDKEAARDPRKIAQEYKIPNQKSLWNMAATLACRVLLLMCVQVMSA
jgi:hypothetical protein